MARMYLTRIVNNILKYEISVNYSGCFCVLKNAGEVLYNELYNAESKVYRKIIHISWK